MESGPLQLQLLRGRVRRPYQALRYQRDRTAVQGGSITVLGWFGRSGARVGKRHRCGDHVLGVQLGEEANEPADRVQWPVSQSRPLDVSVAGTALLCVPRGIMRLVRCALLALISLAACRML